MRHRPLGRIPRLGAFLLAFVAGVAMSLQAHINGQLGAELGSGITAATLSFAGGVVLLALATLASTSIRRGIVSIQRAISTRSVPWTFTLAGSAGAAFVLSQSTVSPLLGLGNFTVAFVCGLTVGGLIMDRWGIGPAGRQPLSILRLSGAALGIAAVVIATTGARSTRELTLALLLPVACGVAVAWQQAANGRLTAAGNNAWSTTLINFSVGLGVLLLGTAIAFAVSHPVVTFPMNPLLYLGGPVGIVFIAIASIVVRHIGILLYGLCATTGQLSSAVLFDVFAPSDATSHAVSATVVLAVIVVAAGAALASLSGLRSKMRGGVDAE